MVIFVKFFYFLFIFCSGWLLHEATIINTIPNLIDGLIMLAAAGLLIWYDYSSE